MAARTYDQFCALARALDVVGERWTLLIVRELLLGPKRFTDLLDGLPGMARNLLAARLRDLEEEGIVRRRRLPAPAASWVYELTDDGRALQPAIDRLAGWGAARLGKRRPADSFRAGWTALALAARADRSSIPDVHEAYQIELEGEVVHLRVARGRVEPREGAAEDPALRIRTDLETLLDLSENPGAVPDALVANRISVEGDPEALQRCLALFVPAAA